MGFTTVQHRRCKRGMKDNQTNKQTDFPHIIMVWCKITTDNDNNILRPGAVRCNLRCQQLQPLHSCTAADWHKCHSCCYWHRGTVVLDHDRHGSLHQNPGPAGSTSNNTAQPVVVEWQIRFKLATKTYKTLHTGHPPYLTDLLQYHKSSVSTCSSTSQLLAIPRHNLSFGSRSFHVSAPKIWNSLTPQIRRCQTLATFRRHLKTHYFQSAFSAT